MKRILVTGAAGFIGFHVALRCLEKGHFVTAVDNFNDYYEFSLKEARARELKKRGLEVKRLDILDEKALTSLLEQEKITHVVHLAAHAGVRDSLQEPHKYVATNIDGFLNVLEACRNGAALIYASSASVYGLNANSPLAESDSTEQQLEVYGVSKKTNELFAACYHHLYNIPCTGLRFFTVYGPWGRPDMAYFAFTRAILEGRPIELYNSGNYRRDFIYIDDVVAAILNALEPAVGNRIYNIGSGRSVSVLELVEALEKALERPAHKLLLPPKKSEMNETCADCRLAQNELALKASTPFFEGIEKFVAWYKAYLSGR